MQADGEPQECLGAPRSTIVQHRCQPRQYLDPPKSSMGANIDPPLMSLAALGGIVFERFHSQG